MSFIRDCMIRFGIGKGKVTATTIELEITASISDLLDEMEVEDVLYLDRIARLNKHVEIAIANFNTHSEVNESERFEAIRCIRLYVDQLNQGFRKCHLLQSRK